jgi:hypothetical protein
MVFQAAFDDSGNAPDQDVLVMGGLLSHSTRWIQFTQDWDALLQATATTPRVARIKYSEITRGKGEFDNRFGWTDAARSERLSALVDTIIKHSMVALFVACRHSHFNKYIRSVPFGGRFVANDAPYATMLEKTLVPTIEYLARSGIEEPCDFYFDTSPGIDGWVQDQWPALQAIIPSLPDEQVPNGVRPTIGSLSFRKETEFFLLQGSDIIAGSVRDRLMKEDLHPALHRLNDLPNLGKILSEYEIEDLGRSLRRRAQRFRFHHPEAELVSYDPATAKRTRKLHSRQVKRVRSGTARPRKPKA